MTRSRYLMMGVLVSVSVVLVLLADPFKATDADHKENTHLFHYQVPGEEDLSFRRGVHAIARNLVIGETIKVCSTDYPESTKLAILRWQSALGKSAFEFSDNCATDLSDRRSGVASVLVYSDKEHSVSCDDLDGTRSQACASHEDVSGHPLYTYFGQAKVHMDPEDFPREDRSERLIRTIAHELGHVLGLDDYYCERTLSYSRDAVFVEDDPEMNAVLKALGYSDADIRKIRKVWYDHKDNAAYLSGLGRIFVGDVITDDASGKAKVNINARGSSTIDHYDRIDEATLMNSWTAVVGCNSPVPVGSISRNSDGDIEASGIDATDYYNAYYPGAVKNFTARRESAASTTVVLDWDADHVHVEKGFVIERKSGSAWVIVGDDLSANFDPGGGHKITGQPTGATTYRVRATTKAFPDEPGRNEAYGHPSAEVVVPAATTTPPVARYTLTVQASPADAVSRLGGDGTYAGGDLATASAVPKSCYEIDRGSAGPKVTMDRDRTITVYLTKIQYTLSTSVSPLRSGSVTPSGSVKRDCGSTVGITASPGAGFRHGTWSGNASGSTSSAASVRMDGDRSVRANFVRQCTLTVRASPAAGGTVSGGGTYDCGRSRTIRASAGAGYHFVDWSGSGIASTSSRSTTVTLNVSKTVTARFGLGLPEDEHCAVLNIC